ncbi:MAG: hypothetical protein A2X87_04640 [Deltaproteobacteria bacterium GWC2_42_51]|nr:MAG: hypothetical protein A2056_04365 [Deltaproteobacteria bacterium GWA2_42_85]OGP29875.1 MAG: hypothetical protein A2067_08275 [Deltaproteobacteria bacterium GWB2_42_7]OGP34012.1 MAG: hypothetical protein A2X87_04640 [Deltaproteobacteria bacterium GWC2_42_51]OGP37859.1 MAG: hypothetical protein A2090_00545 [Deltaproteobacteria bacterium GWD2_42_10]OGP48009.1 MAG: hypothetical protein A2022_11310 [Deltaproteobacteria bacterium GWF2_42_12]OGQ29770.1 MAG: hypothetical protein A3D29_02740 [De
MQPKKGFIIHISKTSLIAGLVCIFFLNPSAFSQSDIESKTRNKPVTIGEYFDGEEFTYNIGFLWFKKAAVGKIGIHKKDDNTYEISLVAETMGFIGFITSYRKDIYHAYVEEVDDGKRFRTKRFEKIVVIGDKTRNGYTEVDYNKRTYNWKSWGGEKDEKESEEQIPPNMYYDDPLTGFYNFRFGVYGKIDGGTELSVPTFPKNNVSAIHIRITSDKEKASRVNPNPDEIAYLADIVIDKEFFGSQTGNVEVHFTKDLIPIHAKAKDIILFGDVTGTLVEITSKMGLKIRN